MWKAKKQRQSLTSNYNKLATDAGAKIEGVEGLAQSIQLIQQGRADLTFNDKLAVLNYLKTSGNKNLKVAFETGDPQETYFAFRKGNAWSRWQSEWRIKRNEERRYTR